MPVFEPQLFWDALYCFMLFSCMSEGAAPSNFIDQDLVPDLESSLLSLLSEMHFAISVVSALQVLHVLLPSSAVTAQPEPEEGCLLQSPGQLALKAEQVVPAGRIDDLQNLCSGGVGCSCTTIASGARNLDFAGCRSFCFPYPAFSRNLQNSFCTCCRSRETLDAPSGFQLETYQFIRTDLSESGRLNRLCEECRCANSLPPGQPRSLTRVGVSDCGYFCQGLGWTTFSHYPAFQNLPASCTCCEGDEVTNVLNGIPMRASYTILDQPATAMGDPHITTLDGHHYTLMQQGIFSLWHLSGLETQFHSENGFVKTVPVDWQVYTRYAGHQAFTKGLLLVDKSGGAVRQIMEMTSEDSASGEPAKGMENGLS